jgi:hypothetical protein
MQSYQDAYFVIIDPLTEKGVKPEIRSGAIPECCVFGG